jgi:hypothetical protein
MRNFFVLLFLLFIFGCEGNAFLKKPNWETLSDQDAIEMAKQSIYALSYDELFLKIVDMFQTQDIGIESKSKAEGSIMTAPYMMPKFVTEATLTRIDNNKTRVKWDTFIRFEGANRLLHKTPEKRAENSEKLNCQLLRYIQTGMVADRFQ